jgi:membrane protein DedA with SNARE-associated domain
VDHFLSTQVAEHGYLAVFVLMVLESVCIPIPSEAIMLFGGALAGGALAVAGHQHVSLVGIALAGAFGNLVGAEIAYVIGRFGGRPLVERWGRYVLLRRRDLDRAHAFFVRRGPITVFVGRMLPVIRTFISLPAGAADMPVVQFSVYTLLGSLPWTFGLAAAGEALASHWSTVSADFTPASVVIAVLAVAAIAWWAVRGYRSRRAGGEDAVTPSVEASQP